MAVKRMEALSLSELLGSMLEAVVEAQARSARATVDFIEDVGFETTDGREKLRTVSLRFTKKDENGKPAEFEVEVPLLSMVNVPALAVKQAKLTFSYDVVTQGSDKKAQPAPSSGLSLRRAKPVKLTGFIRTKPTATSDAAASSKRTTAIDLEVTLEQQEVPLGVERLFDLAELGITEKPVVEENNQ